MGPAKAAATERPAISRGRPPSRPDARASSACGVGVNAQLAIGESADVQHAAERAMDAVALSDVIAAYRDRAMPS